MTVRTKSIIRVELALRRRQLFKLWSVGPKLRDIWAREIEEINDALIELETL